MKEERRHPRFHQEVVVIFEPVQPSASPQTGLVDMPAWLLGLSEGGAMLRTERFLPVGTSLRVQLTIGTSAHSHILLADGIVRWAKSVEEGHPFNIGIEFMDIPPSDRAKLRAYLKDLENDPSAQPQ